VVDIGKPVLDNYFASVSTGIQTDPERAGQTLPVD
jgi:hypothetical protein